MTPPCSDGSCGLCTSCLAGDEGTVTPAEGKRGPRRGSGAPRPRYGGTSAYWRDNHAGPYENAEAENAARRAWFNEHSVDGAPFPGDEDERQDEALATVAHSFPVPPGLVARCPRCGRGPASPEHVAGCDGWRPGAPHVRRPVPARPTAPPPAPEPLPVATLRVCPTCGRLAAGLHVPACARVHAAKGSP